MQSELCQILQIQEQNNRIVYLLLVDCTFPLGCACNPLPTTLPDIILNPGGVFKDLLLSRLKTQISQVLIVQV